MAQSGYTPILIYASGTATNIPAAGDLISGSSGAELAINYADGKLYYKDGSGNVKLLSIGYGSSSVTPTNGGVQYGTGTALALTAAGSSGQILRSNGAAAPTWADLSTLGVNTISFGTTGLTPNSATAGAVTVAGTLVTSNGGTGLGGATPFTANGVLYASSASALTSGSALTFDGSNFVVADPRGVAGYTSLQIMGGSSLDYPTINSLGSGPGTGTAQLAFKLNSSEGMRLTSTGLGIGTSSPGGLLQVGVPNTSTGSLRAYSGFVNIDAGYQSASVSGTAAAPSLIWAGDDNTGIWHPASDTLAISTAGTERMRLDSSGNLGLGVTPNAWHSSFQAFQVSRGSLAGSTGELDLSHNAFFNGTNWIYVGNGFATNHYQANGSYAWRTAPSGTAGNAITFTQAMTLDASGRLGLGITSPTQSLHVVNSSGNCGLTLDGQSATAKGAYINFKKGGTDTAYIGQASAILGTGTSNDLLFLAEGAINQLFYTNGFERARITSGGDLLVGTTTAGAGIGFDVKLAVDAGSGETSVFKTSSSGAYPSRMWNSATTGDNAFSGFLTEGGSGTLRGSITYNRAGGLVAYNTTSDYRAKDIIGPLQNVGAIIDALKVYEGVMKGATQSRPMLIAHEAQAHAPYAVTGEKDAFNEDGTPKFQQIDVSSLVPLLLAEIQSLRQRVALLEGN